MRTVGAGLRHPAARGLLAAALIAALAAPAAGAPPLRIGLTLGLTGTYADLARYQRQGYELWAEDVNRRGGILGRRVELLVEDDGSDPAAAARRYERLAAEERVDLVFSPYGSSVTEAVLPVAARHGYPLLAAGAAADRLWTLGHRNLFGLFLPASRFAVGFLDLANRHGLRRVGIVADRSALADDFAPGARTWAGRFGLEVVLFERFGAAAELPALVARARGAGVEALLFCGYLDDAVGLHRALDAAGWRPRALYVPVGPGTEEYLGRAGAGADLVFTTSQWGSFGKVNPPGSEAFNAAFRARYGRDPSYFAATAYAAGQVLEAAAAKAGTLDRGALVDTIATMDTVSIIGRFGVDRTGVQLKNFNLVLQVRGGRREVVWPDEYATAAPLFR